MLDQIRERAAARGYPAPTVAAFIDWARRYIPFHHKRQPRELTRVLKRIEGAEAHAVRLGHPTATGFAR